MESSRTAIQQEEPLDLSIGTVSADGTSDEQQQMMQLIETCGIVLQQNLFAFLLQSMAEAATVGVGPLLLQPEASAEKENTCEEKKQTIAAEEEHESSPSPTEPRRRTSSGKVDRRMVGKVCTRRVEANARERNRVQQLSKMFDQLRFCLPIGDDSKISKLATLKVASAYIGFLGSLLSDNPDEEDESRTKLQEELESAKTLRK